jgi:hypothetical protein
MPKNSTSDLGDLRFFNKGDFVIPHRAPCPHGRDAIPTKLYWSDNTLIIKVHLILALGQALMLGRSGPFRFEWPIAPENLRRLVAFCAESRRYAEHDEDSDIAIPPMSQFDLATLAADLTTFAQIYESPPIDLCELTAQWQGQWPRSDDVCTLAAVVSGHSSCAPFGCFPRS